MVLNLALHHETKYTMKTIALFGATGQTGRQFLQLALERGHAVRALVRTPSRLDVSHPALTVVAGDVLSASDVDTAVRGTDVVMSLFGHVKDSPAWLQTNGTRHIVTAMKAHGVGRIVSLSGGGLPYPEKDQPKFADRLIRTLMKIAVPKILNDAVAHHGVLKESGLTWVVVRAPRLTNNAARGSYRVGWVGVNASTKVSRADLAHFLVKQIEDETFNFQMPFVSY